ncbi:MAG: c-type cytochrome [Candidatus Methylomirabilia bacterium]
MNLSFFTIVAAAVLTVAAAPAFSAEPSPLAAGKALYEQTCAGCHTLERSLAKQADKAGWESTIKKMVANGAKLGEAQSGQILGFLAAKSAFETKCNTCHDLQRPLTAIKNPEQWKVAVQRMAAMKPGHLGDADAGAITLYLSLVTPVKPAAPAAPAYK